MKNPGVVTVSGLVRVLMLLAVLAGVLAMHALTMNHDPAMATMPPSGAGQHHVAPAHSAPPTGHAGMPVGEATAATTRTAELPRASNLTISAYLSAGAHQMGVLCVAVLAAALALVGLVLILLWMRSARFAPWARQLLPVQLSPLLGRSPPWLAPSLSKLCVLRT